MADICKKLGVSENTFHRWRARYGGMRAPETKRLRELEKENVRLKKNRDRAGPAAEAGLRIVVCGSEYANWHASTAGTDTDASGSCCDGKAAG